MEATAGSRAQGFGAALASARRHSGRGRGSSLPPTPPLAPSPLDRETSACALIPDIPNDEVPATGTPTLEAETRGAAERKATAAAAGGGGASFAPLPPSLLSLLLQSSSAEAAIGLRLRRLAIGVATRERSRPATASRPTPPAAPSECPSEDLAEASARGRGGGGAAEEEGELAAPFFLAATIASDAAPSSMGSPRGVPVPCMASATRESDADERRGGEGLSSSSADDADKLIEASSSAEPRSAACAGPEGAVSAVALPPWLTAEARRQSTASRRRCCFPPPSPSSPPSPPLLPLLPGAKRACRATTTPASPLP